MNNIDLFHCSKPFMCSGRVSKKKVDPFTSSRLKPAPPCLLFWGGHCLVEQNHYIKSLKFTISCLQTKRNRQNFLKWSYFIVWYWISRWKGHWKLYCNHPAIGKSEDIKSATHTDSAYNMNVFFIAHWKQILYFGRNVLYMCTTTV